MLLVEVKPYLTMENVINAVLGGLYTFAINAFEVLDYSACWIYYCEISQFKILCVIWVAL